jgi:dTDP-D-glucose 4,6-dehydratase
MRSYPIENMEIKGWLPDSKNIESAIEKTVLWYKANQWALK